MQRRFSRRTVLAGMAGLVGLVGLGVAGGILGRHASSGQPSVPARSPTLYTYRGQMWEIEALAWSPDSQRIASTDADTLQVWDALSGGHVQTFPDPAGIESIAWSPNGKYLASGSWDRTASIWEVATGKKVLTYYGHGQLQDGASSFQAFSRARKAPETMALVLHRPTSLQPLGIASLAWSPDSARLLSTGGDRTTQVWEALTGQTLLTFDKQLDPFAGAVWSPDGQHLLIFTMRGVEMYDATSGALQSIFGLPPIYYYNYEFPVAWSPDRKEVAAYNIRNDDIQLWELATGRLVLTYQGHSDIRVAWSPDGRHLVSGGQDAVHVWDAASGRTEYI